MSWIVSSSFDSKLAFNEGFNPEGAVLTVENATGTQIGIYDSYLLVRIWTLTCSFIIYLFYFRFVEGFEPPSVYSY